jgi:hypothetical protein
MVNMLNRLNYESELIGGCFNTDYTVLTLSESVVFKLPKSYPFYPPTLFIDSMDHVSYLLARYCTLKPTIDKYKISIDCFCCANITCSWSPCNTCMDVYKEYMGYLRQLKMCENISYLSKLPFDDNVCNLIASYVFNKVLRINS